MKRLLLAAGILAAAGAAAGAEIHGTISDGAKPVPAGTAVTLACGGTSAKGATDQYGSYSVKIGATGECNLSLDWKGASPSLSVAVYEKPSRYDLVVAEEAGKPVLRRK
jgi:hypothetical protein